MFLRVRRDGRVRVDAGAWELHGGARALMAYAFEAPGLRTVIRAEELLEIRQTLPVDPTQLPYAGLIDRRDGHCNQPIILDTPALFPLNGLDDARRAHSHQAANEGWADLTDGHIKGAPSGARVPGMEAKSHGKCSPCGSIRLSLKSPLV